MRLKLVLWNICNHIVLEKSSSMYKTLPHSHERGCVKTIIENDKTIKFKHVVEIR